MKTNQGVKQSQAFTLFEVLIVIAVLIFFAALILPALHKAGSNKRISCVNNLKQVGLAYRVWSGDNGDKYPMAVSTNQGGSMERALAGDVVLTFQVMSNELSTPKILVCPNDVQRKSGTNFTDLTKANISYFVGVDAVETNASMWLGGDRNMTTGEGTSSDLKNITTNQAVRWTGEIHKNAGNILMADASVQQLSSSGLRGALTKTGIETNRLAFP
ncbi:MAG TPA: type II secretion system protein [Verrucomicrobiae bacterium]|nr:type II secretion system protein [Verrucomicrobiae bacterium]